MLLLYIRQRIIKTCILFTNIYKLYTERYDIINNIILFKKYIAVKRSYHIIRTAFIICRYLICIYTNTLSLLHITKYKTHNSCKES
ncbi:hypothetical protein ChPV097 [Cheloniid poxvirus 1]|nr:hypothetical protein ChPV097 [Cheloniid poxvirus 1]